MTETLAAFVDKTLDADVTAAEEAHPEVVPRLRKCAECREAAVDILGILWLDFLGLIEEPPEYPEFDFSFLKKG